MRVSENLLVVRLVDLVRDDRRPFRDESPQSADVIEMRVRVDHIPDPLVRNQPLRLADDLLRPHIVLWPLNHYDVIFEIRDDGAVAAGDQPEAAAEILSLHRRRRPPPPGTAFTASSAPASCR